MMRHSPLDAWIRSQLHTISTIAVYGKAIALWEQPPGPASNEGGLCESATPPVVFREGTTPRATSWRKAESVPYFEMGLSEISARAVRVRELTYRVNAVAPRGRRGPGPGIA